MKQNSDKGWSEVIIKDNCDFDTFYEAATILEQEFAIEFPTKLNDLDSIYWDFTYHNQELTLHYIYIGVTISPTALRDSSETANEKAIEIGSFLIEKMKDENQASK